MCVDTLLFEHMSACVLQIGWINRLEVPCLDVGMERKHPLLTQSMWRAFSVCDITLWSDYAVRGAEG